MRTGDHRTAFGSDSLESTCEAMLLGRLGSEIASIYHDTLGSPLPARLQELVARLDDVSGLSRDRRRERDTA